MDGPERQRPGTSWNKGEPEPDYLRTPRTPYRPPDKPTPEPPHTGDKPPDDKEKDPKEKPIDPGMPVKLRRAPGVKVELDERFPKLKPIIEKLDAIGEETFWGKFENLNPEYPQMLMIATDMRDAMLFKAIADGWGEEKLYKEYRGTMDSLLIQCTSRPVLSELLGHMKRAFRALFKSDESLPPNPHLANRKLKRRDRGRLLTDLKLIDPKLVEEDTIWDNYCIKWDGDECDKSVDSKNLNEDQLEFVEETVFEFYRSYLINRRLVEDKSADDIKNEWPYWAASLYGTCLGGGKGAADDIKDRAKEAVKENIKKGIWDKLKFWD